MNDTIKYEIVFLVDLWRLFNDTFYIFSIHIQIPFDGKHGRASKPRFLSACLRGDAIEDHF